VAKDLGRRNTLRSLEISLLTCIINRPSRRENTLLNKKTHMLPQSTQKIRWRPKNQIQWEKTQLCGKIAYRGVRTLAAESDELPAAELSGCCGLVCCASAPYDWGGLANRNWETTFQSMMSGVRSHQMSSSRPPPASATAPAPLDTVELYSKNCRLSTQAWP